MWCNYRANYFTVSLEHNSVASGKWLPFYVPQCSHQQNDNKLSLSPIWRIVMVQGIVADTAQLTAVFAAIVVPILCVCVGELVARPMKVVLLTAPAESQ